MAKNLSTPLYIDTTKRENLFGEIKAIENAKITKWSHAYKGYVSS